MWKDLLDARHFRIVIIMTWCILGPKRHKSSGQMVVCTPQSSGKSFVQLASEDTITEHKQLGISIRQRSFSQILQYLLYPSVFLYNSGNNAKLPPVLQITLLNNVKGKEVSNSQARQLGFWGFFFLAFKIRPQEVDDSLIASKSDSQTYSS